MGKSILNMTRAERKAFRAARRARRDAQWKANAEAEASGEFVPDPTSPLTEEMQRELWERNQKPSGFWSRVLRYIRG